jgi:hypothetical protein
LELYSNNDLISTFHIIKRDYQEQNKMESLHIMSSNLWCLLPNVKESGLLDKMSKKEIELQERFDFSHFLILYKYFKFRWFEIFHSELSYNKTLTVLNNVIIFECKKELSEYNLNLIFTRNIDTIIQLSNT